MTLRLRVVSDQRRSLGDRSSIVLSAEGASIGRSADNDWVLPDPLRYVSAHHARIEYRDGNYYVLDTSTNGVFLNDGRDPIARQGAEGVRLRNGDMLRVGDYQIVVAIDSAVSVPGESDIVQVPTSIHALHTVGRAAQTDIGASLNLDELLMPDPPAATGDPIVPVNAYGQAVAASPVRAMVEEAVREPDEESIARRIARLARAAGRDPRNAASAPALHDVASGLQAFCRGAGIDSDRLPVDAQTRLLHLAGQLFREALVGLKDLERSRNEARNRFRIELDPPDPDDPRPVLARTSIEDLVMDLLLRHENRSLDAVQWIRETIDAGKNHERAGSRATRAAFIEFLDRLDPAELEARFERAARRGRKSADKAQYWDMYTSFYRNIVEMPADHLPHTFVEAFAAAYRRAFRNPEDQGGAEG